MDSEFNHIFHSFRVKQSSGDVEYYLKRGTLAGGHTSRLQAKDAQGVL